MIDDHALYVTLYVFMGLCFVGAALLLLHHEKNK